MARSANQKSKLLYVRDFLLRNSDQEHPVTVNQIIGFLSQQDIRAERKSIYDDIETLRRFGLDIIQTKEDGRCGYYVGDREFQLPELKLLVDSVQASKFITHKKTVSLIKKIEGLSSVYQARQLSRQVFVANRINAAVTREACSLLEKGIATVEDIDTACEKGLGYPMGPFRLMDLTGIDVNYYVRRDRYAESGDENDKPSPLVIEKFKKGEFGRKTGKGWYDYTGGNGKS